MDIQMQERTLLAVAAAKRAGELLLDELGEDK